MSTNTTLIFFTGPLVLITLALVLAQFGLPQALINRWRFRRFVRDLKAEYRERELK